MAKGNASPRTRIRGSWSAFLSPTEWREALRKMRDYIDGGAELAIDTSEGDRHVSWGVLCTSDETMQPPKHPSKGQQCPFDQGQTGWPWGCRHRCGARLDMAPDDAVAAYDQAVRRM